jgi:hypothetical protein
LLPARCGTRLFAARAFVVRPRRHLGYVSQRACDDRRRRSLQERCGRTAASWVQHLSGRTVATDKILLALEERQEDNVCLVGGKLRIHPIEKSLGGGAAGLRPVAVDLPIVATQPLQLPLCVPRDREAIVRSRWSRCDRFGYERCLAAGSDAGLLRSRGVGRGASFLAGRRS